MTNDQLKTLRHSAEHVLHQAIKELFPQIQLAMGPATDEGFYTDFDPTSLRLRGAGVPKISEGDFPKIEERMRELVNLDLPLTRMEISAMEAKELFKNNPYKLEWIDEIEKEIEIEKRQGKETQKISIYWTGKPGEKNSFVDLCKGPHVESTGEIKAFKLLSIAGAYWHGDEKNKMLTRIYGTAFATKEELEKHLWQTEEAKKRDHRKIGKELGLFVLSNEVGPGLVLWAPKGATVRRELENFIIEEQTKRGYQHVYTPHIGKKQLWQTSGHWDLYREKMYSSMSIDDDEYLVKPMNCPFHMMIYKSQPRSYKELPLKLAEIASVYRYEKAGELSGMLRVRYITQDDSHIFCTEEQVADEFIGVFEYMEFLLDTFGLKDYYLRLGLRSPKEKYLGNDKTWEKAEKEIVKAIEKKGLKFVKSEGDAAFYGPKLDVIIKDSLGREWQCGTIQIDFMLPERFELEYIDKDGQKKRPVLIHRAPLGSLERWMAILIEHYGGAFPTWLNPVQVRVLPIAERHAEYARTVVSRLKSVDIRVELDDRNETLGARIRDGQNQKVSYMLIVGDKEVESRTVAERGRSGKDYGQQPLEKFIKDIREEIEKKVNT